MRTGNGRLEDGDNGDEGLSAGGLVGWDDFDGVLAGLGVSGTALSSVGIVDVSLVAEEVNTAADHADEEVLAVGLREARNSEEFFSAVDLVLRDDGAEREGDEC